MKSCFKYRFSKKNLWIILALYFLNIAVDPTDAIYYDRSESASTNNQESIIELVIEKALGFEDAIPEQNDNDDQGGSVFKKIKLQEFVFNTDENKKNSNFYEFIPAEKIFSPNYFLLNFSAEVTSPPPKV
jgi:hypothetical protein